MCARSDIGDVDLDVDSVIETLETYPVRYAVLYGSHAHGVATEESDVDVAVAFDETLSELERFDRRIELVVDLMDALGTDNVDVADLDAIRPEVGLDALETGHVLVGDQETCEEYRERFEREVPSAETHEDRMRRFDAILDRLEETV